MKFRLLFSSLIVLSFFFSCQGPAPESVKVITAEQASYISGYTKGIISVKSGINLWFQKDLPSSYSSGDVINKAYFSISPKISGQLKVVSGNQVEFIPDELLEGDQIYTFSINLHKLFKAEKEIEDFVFDVRTIRQDFNVYTDELLSYEENQQKKYRLKGRLNTADYLPEGKLEDLISAKQENQNLPISWESSTKPREFLFTIDNIMRHNEQTSEVEIIWNGKKIGIDNEGSEKTTIPALNDFKILHVKVHQLPEQFIEVAFSDPLKQRQDFEGLVYTHSGTKFNFEINENILKAYPSTRQKGETKFIIEPPIYSVDGFKIKQGLEQDIAFSQLKPQVEFIGQGNILPSSEGLILPFRAVNLQAVDITIFKIFTNNVSQFLQNQSLDETWELGLVGRPITKQRIMLNQDASLDLGQWNTFSIDLTPFVEDEMGAIYNVKFSFKKAYSLYRCDEDTDESEEDNSSEMTTENLDHELNLHQWSETTYYSNYYYPNDYSWRERDNPCHVSYYYYDRWISKNILASNFGLIAKETEDKKMAVYITDLRSTIPVEGVNVQLLDAQKQLLAEGLTNADGMFTTEISRNPVILIANKSSAWGYLKLNDGYCLSTSIFNVNGKRVYNGLKGFVYGERGVWRPGDTLFLTFMLNDPGQSIPADHPVKIELRDPQYKVRYTAVKTHGVNGFYAFNIKTGADDPTGNWTAIVSVGGNKFTHPLRIETVKPNRLKVKLDFGTDFLPSDLHSVKAKLEVKWLHGAIARNLRTDVTLTLKQDYTSFEKYKGYLFYESGRRGYESSTQVIFDDMVDDKGEASFTPDISLRNHSLGMLQAHFMVRAFEQGGAFSTVFKKN